MSSFISTSSSLYSSDINMACTMNLLLCCFSRMLVQWYSSACSIWFPNSNTLGFSSCLAMQVLSPFNPTAFKILIFLDIYHLLSKCFIKSIFLIISWFLNLNTKYLYFRIQLLLSFSTFGILNSHFSMLFSSSHSPQSVVLVHSNPTILHVRIDSFYNLTWLISSTIP